MALNLEVFNFDTYKKMDLGGKLYIIPFYSTDEHLCFKTRSALHFIKMTVLTVVIAASPGRTICISCLPLRMGASFHATMIP